MPNRVVRGSPLLDLVEGLGHGDGDEDDDGLLAALDVDLSGLGDLELSKLRLEVRDVLLEVEQGLGDLLLNLRRGSSGRVGGPQDFVLVRHGAGVSERSSGGGDDGEVVAEWRTYED